jgi:hypothetical protein
MSWGRKSLRNCFAETKRTAGRITAGATLQ